MLRMRRCERQAHLQQVAVAVLRRIDELSDQQMKALHDSDYKLLLKLDEQMEREVGKRERAFGALFNHCRKHGCSFGAHMNSVPQPERQNMQSAQT